MKYSQLYEDVKKLVEKEDYRKGIAYLSWDSFTVYYNTARYRILNEITGISSFLYEEEIYDDLTGSNYYDLSKEGIVNEVFWHQYPYDDDPYPLTYASEPIKNTFTGSPLYYNVSRASGNLRIVISPAPSTQGKIYIFWTPILNSITSSDYNTDIPFPLKLYDFVKFIVANYILELEKKYNQVLKTLYLEEKKRLMDIPYTPRQGRVFNKLI